MIRHGNRVGCFVAVFCVFLLQTAKLPATATETGEVVYNRGQAAYDSRNPDKSRSEAVADLKAEV
ncbi:MAG TPA: hypothetical protein DCZ69_10405, partial [Syntrophobacteraceae bacterium]|nr:hypothetical protein [Syntrophobacteraceae bacterium]